MRPTKVLGLLLLSLFAFGCGRGHSTAVSNGTTKQKFDHYYAQWQKECEEIKYCSSVLPYTRLPAFRSIVALGRPALPYLRAQLEQDQQGGFMLAYAVAEICGWKRSDFDARSEQDFQDMVLARMRLEK